MPEIQERTTVFELTQKAASHIQLCAPDELKKPEVGIICGSGLGGLVATLETSPQFAIPYSDIPGFPQSTGQNPKFLLIVLTDFWK
jgi:purine-nucleoside phosphorylase